MGLRAFVDRRIAPHFERGGKLHRFHVFYEMFDTMAYSPPDTTRSTAHVRDGMDLKRVMMTVWFAILPALFFGMINAGYQANLQITEFGYNPIPGWRTDLVVLLAGFDHGNWIANLLHGAVYYLPIFIVVHMGGFLWEGLFAWKRGHEINEGFLVTGILFTLILPPTIPLWMVFLGISFGVVLGKEVFGGTGKNFLNPALTGRAFLFFAYPASLTGDAIWTAVDDFTGATPLALAATGDLDFNAGLTANASLSPGVDLTWMQTALGGIQGSVGETSTLVIGLGLVILLITKVASWRIMLSMLLGMIAMASVFNWAGSETNPLFAMPWYWHLTLGSFAFGLVYMATDPVSASMTNAGKWLFGSLIGVMVVLIRVVNPAFPEGVMLAILFGNLCAPLIDYAVIKVNIARRKRRLQEVPGEG